MKWNLDTGIATTNISCSNICITPFTSVSSFLPHISHPTPLVHTCICALLFLQGHILPGWLTASNCLLTSITVFLLLLAKRVMLQYLSNKHGFKVVGRIGRSVIFLFQYQVLNLQPFSDKTLPASSIPALSVQVEKDVAQQERKGAEELERGVYLCVVHDIFFTLRLLSCTAVNMMDNVLGLSLLGVICCLYHQL